MTAEFLLDTNVLSEPLKPSPSRILIKNLRLHEDKLAMPSIVWHELLFGCYRLPVSRKRKVIEEYLNEIGLEIIPYDGRAAQWHAAERARLIRLGKTPSFVDGQIAAIAVTRHLTLVTFDVLDFSNFEGIKLADWRK